MWVIFALLKLMWIHVDPDPDPQPSDAGGDGPGAGGREGGEGGPRGGLSLQAGTERFPHVEPALVLFGLQQGNAAYGNEIRNQIALIDIPEVRYR